ncbi:hypothetical protein Taro_003959 [Colocasia esculenta]|uniref:Uncharacterized protein n=1 Tax=Colocasia esculenta TaxID=4460 RepID=A0A843TN65_COLES|nr:hypothetical protein [Colocasia esculenta]
MKLAHSTQGGREEGAAWLAVGGGLGRGERGSREARLGPGARNAAGVRVGVGRLGLWEREGGGGAGCAWERERGRDGAALLGGGAPGAGWWSWRDGVGGAKDAGGRRQRQQSLHSWPLRQAFAAEPSRLLSVSEEGEETAAAEFLKYPNNCSIPKTGGTVRRCWAEALPGRAGGVGGMALACMCAECAKALRLQSNKCPICRQPVEELMEIKVQHCSPVETKIIG